MAQYGQVIIDLHETWPKQTLRNRCVIGGPNDIQILTVPVKKLFGSHTKTSQITVDYTEPWPSLMLKSLKTAYSKSPFFLYYSDALIHELNQKHEFLHELNARLFKLMMNWLQLSIEVNHSESYISDAHSMADLRPLSKHHSQWPFQQVYYQPFSQRFGFRNTLSVFDIIFNLGPEAGLLIKNQLQHASIPNH